MFRPLYRVMFIVELVKMKFRCEHARGRGGNDRRAAMDGRGQFCSLSRTVMSLKHSRTTNETLNELCSSNIFLPRPVAPLSAGHAGERANDSALKNGNIMMFVSAYGALMIVAKCDRVSRRHYRIRAKLKNGKKRSGCIQYLNEARTSGSIQLRHEPPLHTAEEKIPSEMCVRDKEGERSRPTETKHIDYSPLNGIY